MSGYDFYSAVLTMSSEYLQLTNLSTNFILPRLVPCRSFLQNFMGLMFRKEISTDEGILLIGSHNSKIESAIHMFFMRFPIAVIWLNDANQVVDKALALPWRPYYAPKLPAIHVLEIHPSHINDFEIGDYVSYA